MKTTGLLLLMMVWAAWTQGTGFAVPSGFAVPQTPRAAIRPISSAPLRLATGDIKRVERLLMNSESTARLLARITRSAARI